MKIRVELHSHTNYSNDSLLGKLAYLFMLKIRKINVIAITDHDELEGALRFKDFLEKFNIRVIPGEEVFSTKGEIIGLFLKEKIEKKMSPRETMLEIKRQGGLVYIPHPYDVKRYRTVLREEEIEKNLDLIDIIEIHNGRNINKSFTEEQGKICDKYCKIGAVGSDAHTIIELGRNYNIIEDFTTVEEFLLALKKGVHVKKECIQLSHGLTKIDKIISLVIGGNFHEMYRVIYKRIKRKIRRTG